MKKINNKGITLMALVITIIILIILASIGTYSGIQVVKSAQFTAFSTELKIMQTQVNSLYEKKKNNEKILLNNVETEIEDIGTAISSISLKDQEKANKAFIASGITDSTDYKYFDTDTIKNLNIEGVEGEFLVNIDKRSVVSYDGFEYEGKTYYTLEQLPDGLYNVEFNEDISNKPTFELSAERLKKNEYKISAKNIIYSGNINNWNLKYKLEGEQNFKETKDLNVKLYEEGTYKIKITNGNFESDEKTIMLREPQIGDYVDYDPTYLDVAKTQPVDSNKLTYISLKGSAYEHGNGYQSQTYTSSSNTKWRVLNILDNNKIEIIPTEIIKKAENEDDGNFVVYGAVGYLYAEQELNEICKIYGYGYGADTTMQHQYTIGGPYEGEERTVKILGSGAKCIKTDDINKLSGIYKEISETGVETMKNKNGNIISGNTYGKKNYPEVNVIYPTLNPEKGDITGKSKLAEIKEIENTYYTYNLNYITNKTQYDMVSNKYYWLASREINTISNGIYWGCQYIKGDKVYNYASCNSSRTNLTMTKTEINSGIIPLVTIKSNLITSLYSEQNIGTETNPWIFK